MSCIKKSFRKIGVLVVVTLSSFVCYAKATPASNLSDDKQITKNIELHKLKYIDYLEEKNVLHLSLLLMIYLIMVVVQLALSS